MGYRMSNKYRYALEKAKTVKDCQKAYEEEWERKYEQYNKEMTEEQIKNGDPFNKLICEEFDIVMKAEKRAEEITGRKSWNMRIIPKT